MAGKAVGNRSFSSKLARTRAQGSGAHVSGEPSISLQDPRMSLSSPILGTLPTHLGGLLHTHIQKVAVQLEADARPSGSNIRDASEGPHHTSPLAHSESSADFSCFFYGC